MLRTNFLAIGLLAAALAAPGAAENTPGPPDWNDSQKSVYLPRVDEPKSAPAAVELATPLAAAVVEQQEPREVNKIDSAVVPAEHSESPQVDGDAKRRLAPLSNRLPNERAASENTNAKASPRQLMDFGIPSQTLYKIATGLTIVIGSFLVFVWVLRRSGRGAGDRRGMLPADAVCVLGRVQLASRQVAELLRVGNKLVLVVLTQGGAETLTEITDPIEVDRLLGLCQQTGRFSTTQAFEQVFQNMSRETAPSGFLGAEHLPPSLTPVAAAYRSHRGDRARA
jgi:flagellar biogenesis protein FliO